MRLSRCILLSDDKGHFYCVFQVIESNFEKLHMVNNLFSSMANINLIQAERNSVQRELNKKSSLGLLNRIINCPQFLKELLEQNPNKNGMICICFWTIDFPKKFCKYAEIAMF